MTSTYTHTEMVLSFFVPPSDHMPWGELAGRPKGHLDGEGRAPAFQGRKISGSSCQGPPYPSHPSRTPQG